MYAISERDAQILLLCYYCVFMTGREHAGPLCACALGVHLLNPVTDHVYVTVFTLMTDYISCMTVLLLFEQGVNVA